MKREVDLHDDLVSEFRAMHEDVQDELLAHIALLERLGPQKELRFDAADGVWRVAFAFDLNRTSRNQENGLTSVDRQG